MYTSFQGGRKDSNNSISFFFISGKGEADQRGAIGESKAINPVGQVPKF